MICDLVVWESWQRMRKTWTPATVRRRTLLNILERSLGNLAATFLTLASRRSGRAGGLAFSQSLEVDGQRLFLWIWRTSVLLLGDHVAHDPPKTHQEESQDVGQNPLWVELGVGGPEHKRHTKSRHAVRQDRGQRKDSGRDVHVWTGGRTG